jgi:hypothetical protein
MTPSAKSPPRNNPAPVARPAPLTLERLEERCVPSAATVDLTTAGASGVVGGAVFQQASPQPTGTGVIHSFLRGQAHGSGATVEQGYNTDARPLQFDEKSGTFTHSIHLSDVPVVVVGGVAYREFLLDINQNQSSPLLSLDQFKLYLGTQGNLTGYNAASGTLPGATPVYDLDAGGDHWVALNSSLSSGSGSGDMFALVPDQLFTSAQGDPNVYLYSRFGDNYGANGGFEEWAVPRPTPPGGLSGYVYFDQNGNDAFNAGESGAGGATITLKGLTADGQTFTLTTTTDSSGFYHFNALPPGTYSLSAGPIAGYTGEAGDVGSLGGLSGFNTVSGIQLSAGQNGLNYDFGELQLFAGS